MNHFTRIYAISMHEHVWIVFIDSSKVFITQLLTATVPEYQC